MTGVLSDSCYLCERNIQNPATLQYYKPARLVLLAAYSWVCPLALPVAVCGGLGEGKVSTPLKQRCSSMGPTGAEHPLWQRPRGWVESGLLPQSPDSRMYFLDSIEKVDWVTGSLGIDYMPCLHSKHSSGSLGPRPFLGTSVGVY